MEEITLEKIDIIRQRTKASYSMAYEALQLNDGNVIKALIFLEGESNTLNKRNVSASDSIDIVDDAYRSKVRSNNTVSINPKLDSGKKGSAEVENQKNKLTFILNSIIEDPSIPQDKKASLIIHATSLTCAIIAVQPIPFADLFVLSPIQLVMVTYLNKAMGNPYEKSKLNEILASLLGIVGWGMIAQHLILGAYKTFVPYIAGVTTIPMVYAATWALGIGAKVLIEAKKDDRHVGDTELKRLVNKAKEEAKKGSAFTISNLKSEIETLTINAKEFQKYKQEFATIEAKLSEIGIYDLNKPIEDIISNTNIGDIYNKKYNLISKRFKDKYRNLEIDDLIISILIFIPEEKFLGEVEKVISQVNDDITKLSISKSVNSTIVEVEADFGIIYVIDDGLKMYVQHIELIDELRDSTVLMDYIDTIRTTRNRKLLRNSEIRDIFVDTIVSADTEIDIISPWADPKVLTPLRDKLQDAINRGVTIKIVYGIGNFKSSNKKKNISKEELKAITTEKVLKQYEAEFSSTKRFKIYKGNTHIKLLICDNKYYVLGSYNYLSFKGDYSGYDVRSEIAEYSESADLLKKLRREFFSF